MESLKDYYLDSLSELKVDGWLYRTKGSAQIQYWHSCPIQSPSPKLIKFRRYFRGEFRNKRFFAKQFLKPYFPPWTIKESVEYQFQNLLLMKDLKSVPGPLFLTNDTVGMEYIEGETIKNLALKNKFNNTFAKNIILQLEEQGPTIIARLKKVGRKYECSYNNVLVKKNGQIIFVDFDYWGLSKETIPNFVEIIKALGEKKIFFTKNGKISKR